MNILTFSLFSSWIDCHYLQRYRVFIAKKDNIAVVSLTNPCPVSNPQKDPSSILLHLFTINQFQFDAKSVSVLYLFNRLQSFLYILSPCLLRPLQKKKECSPTFIGSNFSQKFVPIGNQRMGEDDKKMEGQCLLLSRTLWGSSDSSKSSFEPLFKKAICPEIYLHIGTYKHQRFPSFPKKENAKLRLNHFIRCGTSSTTSTGK